MMLVLFCACLVLMTPAAHVSAHASLLSTSPGDGDVLDDAPVEAVLEFSEPVGPVEGATSLFADDGEPVELQARASGSSVVVPLPEALNDGSYVLQWRVISQDSHPIGGTITFSIGDAGDAPTVDASTEDSRAVEVANGVAQVTVYLGMFAAVGITLFQWLVAPLRSATAKGIVVIGSLAAMIALILLVPLTTIRQTAGELGDLFTAEPWVDRTTQDPLFMGLVGIAGLAGLLVLFPKAGGNAVGWWAPSVAGLIALLSLPIVGHTRTREPVVVMILMDEAHVMVGALWFGGMIALMLYLRGSWSRTGDDDGEQAASVVARYSGIAGLILPVIGISGASMALIMIDGLDALTGTTYGTTLIAKIGVVAIIVLIASWNRIWLVPAAEKQRPGRAMAWLRRTVTAEAVLLAVVLVLSGFLVMESPVVSDDATGAEPAAEMLVATSALDDDHTVELRVDPAGVGGNTVMVVITDTDGVPLVMDRPIELRWSLPEQGLGPITMMMREPDEDGIYRGRFEVPFDGLWEVEIRATIDRFTDSRTTIEVPIPNLP